MGDIYFTSDLHFGHDRDFIWQPRGFKNIHEHDEEIIKRYNSIVQHDDDVYILGDLMLGDKQEGVNKIRQLNGHKHIILGNHDTSPRIELYKTLYDTVIEGYATMMKYKGNVLYLSHYPTIVANGENISVTNLYGHTHQKDNFFEDRPYCYHVGVDSHTCYPIKIDKILEAVKQKKKER